MRLCRSARECRWRSMFSAGGVFVAVNGKTPQWLRA
jgi:hypothetical protein